MVFCFDKVSSIVSLRTTSPKGIDLSSLEQLHFTLLTSDTNHTDVLVCSLETLPRSLTSLHIILSLDNRSVSDDMKTVPDFFALPFFLKRFRLSINKKHLYSYNCVDEVPFATALEIYFKSMYPLILTDVHILPHEGTSHDWEPFSSHF